MKEPITGQVRPTRSDSSPCCVQLFRMAPQCGPTPPDTDVTERGSKTKATFIQKRSRFDGSADGFQRFRSAPHWGPTFPKTDIMQNATKTETKSYLIASFAMGLLTFSYSASFWPNTF